MKKYMILTVALIWATALTAEAPPSVTQVDVYYFHFSRRCATCLNVEKVTKESVESLYPDQVRKGEITFKSINLDEDDGEALGKKNGIEGQTLIVICGDKRVDLTDKAFLYANGSSEKLKKEIKSAIEKVQE